MRVRDPNNVTRAVRTNPTLLRYVWVIKERNKRNVGSCWLIGLNGFKLCATTSKNKQQHATKCNWSANGRNM